MQQKVLVIEDSPISLKVVSRLVTRAGFTVVSAGSLTEAMHRFGLSKPEDFLCAIVDFNLPDAPNGEAIDFTINAYLPTIVITGQVDVMTREAVLNREVVDYIPKENTQVYDYLGRLLLRLERNKYIGVLVVDSRRKTRAAMAALLKRHNFIVYEANSAESAMTLLSEHPHIRMVLTDDAIPDQPGTEFVANLRKAFSKEELAIIGVSEGDSALLSARFIKSGANDFLRKPYCHEEFLCRITQNLELIENVEAIRKAANTDYLTGLPNRRHFFYSVNVGLKKLPEKQALAILDLDFFKQVNDTYGHDAGDAVLQSVSAQIAEQFDDVFVARFGGEEFCIYLPGHTSDQAFARLESFRESIATTPVHFNGHLLEVTTSIGMAARPSHNIDTLVSEADKLLYKAKSQGRNQICRAD